MSRTLTASRPVRIERVTLTLEDLGYDPAVLSTVERALGAQAGVQRVHVNAETEMAYVAYDPARCRLADLRAAVATAGCRAGAVQRCAAPPPGAADDIEGDMMETDHSCCAPEPIPAASTPRSIPAARQLAFRWRLATFSGIALLVLGMGIWLAVAARMPNEHAMYQVDMSMSGFQPPRLVVAAHQAATLQLNNVDSPFHAITNGALHQFAIDALSIDVKLDGRQSRTITLPALAPGTYEYYCNVCCGGQVNPAMRGTLVVQ